MLVVVMVGCWKKPNSNMNFRYVFVPRARSTFHTKVIINMNQAFFVVCCSRGKLEKLKYFILQSFFFLCVPEMHVSNRMKILNGPLLKIKSIRFFFKYSTLYCVYSHMVHIIIQLKMQRQIGRERKQKKKVHLLPGT